MGRYQFYPTPVTLGNAKLLGVTTYLSHPASSIPISLAPVTTDLSPPSIARAAACSVVGWSVRVQITLSSTPSAQEVTARIGVRRNVRIVYPVVSFCRAFRVFGCAAF